MKSIFILSILLFSISVLGQVTPIEPLINFKKKEFKNDDDHIYKWEAYTGHGAIIFGVTQTKADAEWVIADFTKRNAKNAYKPIGHVIKKIEIPTLTYVSNFKKKHPKGYKVLLQRDVIALRMIKVSSMNTAADFIESVTKKSNAEAFEYVFKLSNSVKTYSIKY